MRRSCSLSGYLRILPKRHCLSLVRYSITRDLAGSAGQELSARTRANSQLHVHARDDGDWHGQGERGTADRDKDKPRHIEPLNGRDTLPRAPGVNMGHLGRMRSAAAMLRILAAVVMMNVQIKSLELPGASTLAGGRRQNREDGLHAGWRKLHLLDSSLADACSDVSSPERVPLKLGTDREATPFRLDFGKHRGELVCQVSPQYVQWMVSRGIHKHRPKLHAALLAHGLLGCEILPPRLAPPGQQCQCQRREPRPESVQRPLDGIAKQVLRGAGSSKPEREEEERKRGEEKKLGDAPRTKHGAEQETIHAMNATTAQTAAHTTSTDHAPAHSDNPKRAPAQEIVPAAAAEEKTGKAEKAPEGGAWHEAAAHVSRLRRTTITQYFPRTGHIKSMTGIHSHSPLTPPHHPTPTHPSTPPHTLRKLARTGACGSAGVLSRMGGDGDESGVGVLTAELARLPTPSPRRTRAAGRMRDELSWIRSVIARALQEVPGASTCSLVWHFVRPLPSLAPEYTQRLATEMRLIMELGFEECFLQVLKVLELAQGMPYLVRGSASGSLVCYLLAISHIDPVKERISLSRFMNALRNDLPDIDLDFPHDQRDTIFQRLFQMLPNHAARISNHITFRTRSAKCEAARRLNVRRQFARDQSPSLFFDGSLLQRYHDTAAQLTGTHRGYSLHCGGVIILASNPYEIPFQRPPPPPPPPTTTVNVTTPSSWGGEDTGGGGGGGEVLGWGGGGGSQRGSSCLAKHWRRMGRRWFW